MAFYRICGCGERLPRGAPCPACEGRRNAARKATYHSPAWRRLSAQILRSHRLQYGDVCPGDEYHDEHPCRDLTVDHIKPLSQGGDLLDRENLRVLCRRENSARRKTRHDLA